MIIKVKDGQSLFDIALMTYGNIESVYSIIQDNGIENVNQNLFSQQSIEFDEQTDFLTNFLRNNALTINTSDPKVTSGEDYNEDYNQDYN